MNHPWNYFTRKLFHYFVASALQQEIDALATRFKNTSPVLIDMQKDQEAIEKLVADHDLTISLLPFVFHPDIAKMCIRQKRNMVTASYVSPEMSDLHRAYVFYVLAPFTVQGLCSTLSLSQSNTCDTIFFYNLVTNFLSWHY